MKWLGALLLIGCPGKDDTDSDPPTDTDVDVDGPYEDPLSAPLTPTLDIGDFQGGCSACHREHAEEWSSSMHAYAMVDPVYRALVNQRNADLNGTEDNFCTQCHSAIGTRGGVLGHSVDFDDLPPVVLEGINCESCHKVGEIVRDHNAGHRLDPTGPVRGVTARPSPFHETEAFPELGESEFCGSCHDVIESNGLQLERPYQELLESPLADQVRCQDCHMPSRRGPIVQGGEESDFHSHRFIGVDLPMTEGFIDQATEDLIRGEIEVLLASSATISVELPDAAPGRVSNALVTVQNDLLAHNFPTGSTFLRQVWVEVIATYDGTPIYETGTLDSFGDLRDHWSTEAQYGDSDLLSLSSAFTTADGSPTMYSWHATEHTSLALSPGYARTWTLFLPVPDGPGELEVSARLLFRPLPPHLLRTLGLPDEADSLPIYTVSETTWSGSL